MTENGIKFNPEETKERELLESLCWGEGEPIMEEYSPGFCCNNDECKRYNYNVLHGEWQGLIKIIKGVKLAPNPKPEYLKYYAAICECPDCFSKFWFHVTTPLADTIKMEKFDL